ncbi:hypothetical protein J5TS2_07980 [Brevibacillus halotolerans]|nr:hypothetical protein J5TS2_07980 [Brevibacillus halotolerans]
MNDGAQMYPLAPVSSAILCKWCHRSIIRSRKFFAGGKNGQAADGAFKSTTN